jgi:putative addiction module component (TIGR02574 family)
MRKMKGRDVMISKTVTDIIELSVAERIQAVEDIWDSIAAVPEAVRLTEHQKAELDRRLEAYHRSPDAGMPWAKVRERIRRRVRQS